MTLRLHKSLPGNLRTFKVLLAHISAWTAFILYEITAIYFATGKWGGIGIHLLYYSFNIGLFYFHAFVVLDFAFGTKRNRYLGGLLLFVAETAIYLLVKSLADRYIESFPIPLNNGPKLVSYLVLNVWRGIYFMGFATAYWSAGRMADYRVAAAESEKGRLLMLRQKAEVEKDLAETRYAHLQQQISPHFIFNALNLIYSSVHKYSETASECVLLLSGLLRYSFSEQDVTGKTRLSKELEQVNNLIAINRLRHDFDLFIETDLPEIRNDFQIIPLVLLTFTENIFKHGNLKDSVNPAKIKLTIENNNHLTFETWNLRKNSDPQPTLKSTGIRNAIKRLEYCYNSAYKLSIQNEPGFYSLKLTLQL